MSSVGIKTNGKIQYNQHENPQNSSLNIQIGSEEAKLEQLSSLKQMNSQNNKFDNYRSSNKKLSIIPKISMPKQIQNDPLNNQNENNMNQQIQRKEQKKETFIQKVESLKEIQMTGNKSQQNNSDKSKAIQSLRQKMGLNKQKTTVFSLNKGQKEGIVKIGIQRFTNWLSMKYKQCCKKKSRSKKNASFNNGQKSSFKEPNKRRSGLSSKETEKSQSSGGEDSSGNSSKTYSKRDSVVQRRQSTVSTASSEQQKIDQEIQMLRDAVKIMSKDKMMEKAYRHLMDGLLYRSVRHDLDGEGTMTKFILFIWGIQNSSFWNDFLLFLGWMYIIMSFFEPSNRNDSSLGYQQFFGMVCLEIFILFLQTLDLVMEAIQRSTQEGQNIFKSIISHKKNFFRLLFFSLNTSDLIYYASSYPHNTFRFARVFRPLQIIIFSKSLRRNFQGIINSAKNLLMILFFDIIITFFWAYIGINIIGDAYADPAIDTFAVDFRNFFKAANVLYIFSSLDIYPDILFPAVTSSFYYILYFLPYLAYFNCTVMFLLLFAPIPVAVVYEGFRKHRLNLLIADRIKRRKALWATFQCIVSDTKRSYIAKPDFVSFFSFVYKKVELDEPAEILADVLWNELDANENKKVSIEEFFTVIDFTEQRKEFRLQRIKPLKKWIEFRDYIQNKYYLSQKLESSWYEIISFFVTIGSCTITILELFLDETSDSVAIADNVDKGFFGFFVLEIILKIVAYGPVNFLDESWNVFDLILVLFQAFFDFIFYSFMKGSSVKSLSASRVLKIAKLQKVFRMFRAFRTVKVLNYILKGLDIIQKVYEMLYKIVICIPIVMKLSVICVIVFYIYAAIGVEIFSTQLRQTIHSEYGSQMCDQTFSKTKDYDSCAYADFNSFGGAVLVLLQVCVGSGWGNVLFDYGKKFNDLGVSALYFNSFHFLSVFVLSLIGGLVWEVFDVVERIMRDQQAYEQQLEIQRQWEEQQQLIEASFQSADNGKKLSLSNSSPSMKRGSVRQSLKIASAFMKLPLIAQKLSMKRNQNMNEDDEEYQEDGDTPQATYLEDRQISKQQSNKQMNDNQNILEDYDSDEDYSDSSDSDDKSSNNDEDDGDGEGDVDDNDNQLNKDQNTQENQNTEFDEENCFKQETKNKFQQPQKQNYQDKPDKLFQNNTLIEDKTNYSNNQKFSKNELTNGQISYERKEDTISLKKTSSFKEISSNKGFVKSNILQTNDSSDEQKGGSFRDSVGKLKRLKKTNKQRKKRKSNEIAQIFRQSCMIDNQIITQRDRSQIILFQDIFKLSTLDQFFKNPPIKPIVQNEVQNDDISPKEKENLFHVIKEEDEEELDLNQQERKHFLKQGNNKSNINKINIQEDFQNEDLATLNLQSDIDSQNIKYTKSSSDDATPLTSSKNKLISQDKNYSQFYDKNNQQIYDKNNRNMEAKKLQGNNNTIPEIYSAIKEEDFEEDIKGSESDIKSKINIKNQQQTLLELQGTLIDLQEEISISRIKDTPMVNQNIIKQLSSPNLRPQLFEKQFSLGLHQRSISKDSSDSQYMVQLFKQTTQDNTQKSQDNESSYKSFRDSIQSNFQNQLSLKQEQNSENNQLVLKNQEEYSQNNPQTPKENYQDTYQNQNNHLPQKNSKQPSNIKLPQNNQESLSRLSSFGGLVFVEETQNTFSEGGNISSSSSNNDSSISSPSIMKKNKSSKKNSLKNDKKVINIVELIEQNDIPSGRKQLPQNHHSPSKKIRDDQEYLTDYSSSDDYNSPRFADTCKISQTSQKIQSDKKSKFSKFDDSNKKNSTKAITSAPILNFLQEKDFSNKNKKQEKHNQKEIQQDPKSLKQLKKNQQSSDNQTFFEDTKQKMPHNQFISFKKEDNSKAYQKQSKLFQNKNSKINIVEQTQDFENDYLNNIQTDEYENSSYKTKEYVNNTQGSKIMTTGNYELSECAFINNTFEDHHNNSPKHQSLFMDKQNNKELKYTNFKKEIDDSSNIQGNNYINDIIKEDLEASFIEEMQHMQESVFEDTKQIEKKQRKLKKHQERQVLRDKHRQELMKYYKNNLLDIDYQTDFQINQNTKPVVFNVIMKQQNLKKEQINQRDQILDNPKNPQMKNNLLNINQDLRTEQTFQMKIDLNNKNYIINKAILKSVDASKIEKIELRHFRQLYGKQFEDMLDNEIFPLWSIQSKLLFHFDNILKYDHIPVEQFIQLYSSLEMQISSLLMNKFSSFKFVYQDHDDKWFTVNFVQEAYFLQEVERQGPWSFFDSLFQNTTKNNIFKHRNIFNYQESNEYIKKSLKKFFQNSQDISNSYYFRKLVINQKRSDVVYIPFVNDNPEQTSKYIQEIIQRTPNLPEYVKKEDLSLDMIPRIKKGIAIAYLFDNPLTKERKRQFTSDYINIEQAIVEEDILTKEQQNATLNYTYSIELLKDMKNHIIMNKDMLFKKISQFYFYRACFERNFCSITEIPFEQ